MIYIFEDKSMADPSIGMAAKGIGTKFIYKMGCHFSLNYIA